MRIAAWILMTMMWPLISGCGAVVPPTADPRQRQPWTTPAARGGDDHDDCNHNAGNRERQAPAANLHRSAVSPRLYRSHRVRGYPFSRPHARRSP